MLRVVASLLTFVSHGSLAYVLAEESATDEIDDAAGCGRRGVNVGLLIRQCAPTIVVVVAVSVS